MNILLINGSPKGKRSNSLRLANSFIEGFKEGYKSKNEAISIDEMHVASMNVGACVRVALHAGRRHRGCAA